MEADVLDDLKRLHEQATKERSHYYVGRTVLRAIEEIERLRQYEPTPHPDGHDPR